jgi:hypothetical protein
MPIHLLREQATPEQVRDMLVEHTSMIKVVVDVRRRVMTGDGDMHYEGEQLLLEEGGEQDDLWGANWRPEQQSVEYESLINIRPRLGNRSIVLQSPELRQQVEAVIRQYLAGVLP